MQQFNIFYTLTDEAPALATCSLLPLICLFTQYANINITQLDISLSRRILAIFPEFLSSQQQVSDNLLFLSELIKKEETIIVKLPNISASSNQVKLAIRELQYHGYNLPNDHDRYNQVIGSIVNPILRDGNSYRKAPVSIKKYVKKNPPIIKKWLPSSKTEVATMSFGDFYHHEKSITIQKQERVRIELVDKNGNTIVLKSDICYLPGEIVDASFMSRKHLRSFLKEQIQYAKAQQILFSIHLKATMMKKSDPLIFGDTVEILFHDFIQKHSLLLEKLGVNFQDGIGNLMEKIVNLPEGKVLEKEILDIVTSQFPLAMVDSKTTTLHTPNHVIVDASMASLIRNGGLLKDIHDKEQDVLAVIPDSCYASVYQTVIAYLKEHSFLDPQCIGSVANIGLMAQAAEEYGSHDTTFEIPVNGSIRIINEENSILLQHEVEQGDIWRSSQTKDKAIQSWIDLAIQEAEKSSKITVFWLDKERKHDHELIKKVESRLPDKSSGSIFILPLDEACLLTLKEIQAGRDIISVTGNVLRDYLTDLFPILELGTSSKMLSLVPLLNGGQVFETGAGGSAPKHVQQFLKENHLRWDSLGEFFALVEVFEYLSKKYSNIKAKILSDSLSMAIIKLLENNRSPLAQVGTIDNRGSHFYLAYYWAEILGFHPDFQESHHQFSDLANKLLENEAVITDQLISIQGSSVDLGGYFLPDPLKINSAMKPSATLNSIIQHFTIK